MTDSRLRLMPRWLLTLPIALVLIIAVACGEDSTSTPSATSTPVVIRETVEVTKQVEVTKEVVVTQIVEVTPIPTPVTQVVMRAPEHNPKRGGVMQAGSLANPAHFDLHQSAKIDNIFPQAPMYDNLVRYSPFDYTTIIPDLAKSWEVSNDGLTYTFSLRGGVQFHDGAILTSEDVKATFDRIIDPPEGIVSPRGFLFSSVDSVNAPDGLTVEFALSEPRGFMLQALANGYNIIVRKATLEDNNFDLRQVPDYPGTGPFRFERLETGEFWELEANPNYWNEELPYLDGLMMFNLALGGAGTGAALLSGRIHYARWIDPATERTARETPGLNTKAYPIAGVVGMYPNHSRPGFSDKKVRRAIHLVIDYHALKKAVEDQFVSSVSGWVTQADPQWTAYWQTAKDLPGWRPRTDEDLAEAKRLMEEAGFGDGMTGVDLLVLNVPFFNTWGIIVQDELKKHLNINSTMRSEDGAVWVQNRNQGTFDLTISGKGANIETMADYWEWYRTGGVLNWTQGYSNPTFDSLHDRIIRESDPAEVADLVAQATAIMEDEIPIFPFGSATDIDGWSDVLKGHRLDRKLGTFHVNRWDTAWLDR